MDFVWWLLSMQVKALKLGVSCSDSVTGLQGMLTHWQYEQDGRIRYLFQPRLLSEDNGLPVPKITLASDRIRADETLWEQVDVPAGLLGQKVKDKASGFEGTVTALTRHINGCFHASLQSPQLIKGRLVPGYDLDLRQLENAEQLLNQTPEEITESKVAKPSPDADAHFEEPLGAYTGG